MSNYKIAFGVFLLLLSVLLTTQLPLQPEDDTNPRHIEQARDLWNRAKKMKRVLRPRVVRRQTFTPAAPTEGIDEQIELLESEGAPKYILELYKNLSAVGVKHPETQANTIRSLKTTSKHPECGEFNFSLDAIHPKEQLTSAELRLYLRPADNSLYDDTFFYVSVEKFKHGSNPEKIADANIMGSTSGWTVFRVGKTVSDWVQNDIDRHNKHHGFRIRVYTDFSAFANGEEPYPCGTSPLQFVTANDPNPDHHPLLMVYTFDPDSENIDYSALSTVTTATPTVNTESPQMNKRQAVSTNTGPACTLHRLEVTNEDLNKIPLITGQEIHLPTSYDAGICGGECDVTFPDEPQHASLIHLLILRESFVREGYRFDQCCAPVRYEDMDVLSVNGDNLVQINRLKNMRVTKCECLDIVVYSNS